MINIEHSAFLTVGQTINVVTVKWYSNFQAATGKISDNIFQLLGPPETLTQGKWEVGDQFSYAYAVAENARMAAYFATFRESFAVLSWVCRDASSFDCIDDSEIHRPGHILSHVEQLSDLKIRR